MSSTNRPQPPKLKSRTETTITLIIKSVETNNYSHKIEYKEPQEVWKNCSSIVLNPGEMEITIDGLNPMCSYEVRLFSLDNQNVLSNPSETVIVDTEVPGCTPKPTCCEIL